MTYKPKLEPPNEPTPPRKTKHIVHRAYVDCCTLKEAIERLSEVSNLEFDQSDFDDIHIEAFDESAEFVYRKELPNDRYDKDMINYNKRLKQYQKDLTKYNEVIKMVETYNKEKTK